MFSFLFAYLLCSIYRTEGNVVESDVEESVDDESVLVRDTAVDISILDTEKDFEVQPKKKKRKIRLKKNY